MGHTSKYFRANQFQLSKEKFIQRETVLIDREEGILIDEREPEEILQDDRKIVSAEGLALQMMERIAGTEI